jgi:AmmeMemoRadiSam system protein A
MEKKGVFVAVFLGSRLKGCMGTVLPVLPVWEGCMENARNAAYKDSRFAPLAVDELDHVSLEITIIGTPMPFTQIAQLDAGIHGLILTKGFRREVFLPDSLRNLPQGIEDILIMLRAKADMDDDPGTPEQWEIFDAEVVSER